MLNVNDALTITPMPARDEMPAIEQQYHHTTTNPSSLFWKLRVSLLESHEVDLAYIDIPGFDGTNRYSSPHS